jgi:hypothetical protein
MAVWSCNHAPHRADRVVGPGIRGVTLPGTARPSEPPPTCAGAGTGPDSVITMTERDGEG